MKKKLLIGFILLLLSGCKLYDEYKMPKDVYINLNSNDYEVYSVKTIEDLIDDSNVEITNSDKKLDTTSLGEIETTIEYKYKKRDYKYVVNYNVVDTEAPKAIYVPNDKTVVVGSEIDFYDKLIYIDNYDRSPSIELIGDYDLNTPGTYNLYYELKDSSNNITKEDFVLNVVEEIEDDDYYDDYSYERIQFSDIVRDYKNENTMIGIDISRWQGNVDFEKVKEAGCEFVIIRMAVSNGKDDPIGLDSYYKENIKNAKKAGLKVGVYIYTAASNASEAKEHAKFVRKNLNKIKLDFPIAYDFEVWDEINELKMNSHDLINNIDEFYNIVSKDGYDVMVYGSKYYLENAWPAYNYKTWLANYTYKTNYKGDYIMWQMCSDGQIDGIDSDVDIDIYYLK